MSICRICGIELTKDNHEHNRCKCFGCRYKESKTYALKYAKERYVEKHDEIRTYQKEYSQTVNGKEANRRRNRKHKTKRERGLGFIPLNECKVDGWEGHHIDKEFVIYVPKELHQSVRHNVFSGKNMDEINFIILQWYILYYGLI